MGETIAKAPQGRQASLKIIENSLGWEKRTLETCNDSLWSAALSHSAGTARPRIGDFGCSVAQVWLEKAWLGKQDPEPGRGQNIQDSRGSTSEPVTTLTAAQSPGKNLSVPENACRWSYLQQYQWQRGHIKVMGPGPWRQDRRNYRRLHLLAVLLLVRCFLSLGDLCLLGKIGIIIVLHRIYSRSQQIFSTIGQPMSIFGLGVHMALGSLLRLSVRL